MRGGGGGRKEERGQEGREEKREERGSEGKRRQKEEKGTKGRQGGRKEGECSRRGRTDQRMADTHMSTIHTAITVQLKKTYFQPDKPAVAPPPPHAAGISC